MDEEEDDEESGYQFSAHFLVILIVFGSPEDVANKCTDKREEEVDKAINVEALERKTNLAL